MSSGTRSAHGDDRRPSHDHHLLLYESTDQQFATVAPYIREGLAEGDRCHYFAHENSGAEVLDELRERGVDVDDASDAGQLSIHAASDVYLSDGTFDPQRTIDLLDRMHSEAIDDGYDRLRVTGETAWANDHDVDADALLEYEKQVDEFCTRRPLVGLCQYRRSEYPSEFIADLLRTHPQITSSDAFQANCYYEPPSERGRDGIDTDSIDRKLRAVSERHRLSEALESQEQCLSLLERFTDRLREADPGEVERVTGEFAAELYETCLVVFRRYESGTGELGARTFQNTVDGLEVDRVVDAVDDRAWTAFVEGEATEFALETDPPVSGVVLPVGRHGALLVGTAGPDAPAGADLAFLTSICRHTEAALDRLARERELEEKSAAMRERNARLERFERINAVVRGVARSIVDATSTADVEESVCELLVDRTDASFVWYGAVRATSETPEPKHAAGDGQGYLDAGRVDDEWAAEAPSGGALRTREIQVVHSISDGQAMTLWRRWALERDFRSAVSLPVVYDGSIHGVITLYGDSPGTFDEEFVSVLAEVRDLVAHALNSIQRKRALVTDSITEIEVGVADPEFSAVEFVLRHDCQVEIDDVVSTVDDETHVFFTVRGASPDQVRRFGAISTAIDDLEILSEGETVHTCESVVNDRCAVAQLLEHNAVVQSMEIEGGETRLVVHIPREKPNREFMDALESKFSGVELVACRDRERPLRRTSEVDQRLREGLTDRQLEILQFAFHSGYFERPRNRTAEELADALDVTHPTVSRHLREAMRRIFAILFEEK